MIAPPSEQVLTPDRYAGHMATKRKVTLYVDEDVMPTCSTCAIACRS
jgi:hypothetical protein